MSGMRLTVVGCSGSYPGPESPASCYLLEADQDGRTWRILLDLGNGALGALHRYADPLQVDGVFISHLHADHCLDLCGYYVMRKYHPEGAQPRIPVWGPAGTADRMARAYDLTPQPGMHEEFDFRELETDMRVGPFEVRAVKVVHPVDAFALRVTAHGRSVVYSGDTAPSDALDELALGSDLLLAEASFRDRDDNPPGIHLTGSDCARTACGASVGRLVLTHVPPWHDPAEALAEAATAWDGPTELATAGATYDV